MQPLFPQDDVLRPRHQAGRRAVAAVVLCGLCCGTGSAEPSRGPSPERRDFFVAPAIPNVGDVSDGSLQHPWRSLSRAAEAVRPGDTVWVRGGVYRETVKLYRSGTGFDRMISFRAVPGEKVVVNGADVLTGWVRAPSEPDRAIWETDWHRADVFPGMICADETPLIPMCVPPATEEMKPPKAYCQYFLGFGRGQAEMRPGTFCYDQDRKKLLVWLLEDDDPNRHVMEGAVRGCWDSRGNYIRVEGICFRYAPLVVPVGGLVFVMSGPGGGPAPADGCIVRDCEVSLGAFEGMYVRGGEQVTTVVEDCWVHHNGNGCGGFEGKGRHDTDAWLIVRRSRFTDNNLFNWNSSWHAGGKHFGTRVFFDECEFARNHRSPGLWFDIHQRDCIVNRCYSHDNGQFQLYYEIGETGVLLNSTAEGAPHCCAVALNGSSRTLVAHNAVAASERGIIVGWEGNVEGQTSRVTCYNAVYNNLLIGRGYPLLTISAETDIARGNLSDNNLYWRRDADARPPTAWEHFEDSYSDNSPVPFGRWQEARGLDLASRTVDPKVEIEAGQVARAPDSPALSGGRRLTPDLVRTFFALKPMPEVTLDARSASIKDHRPPSEAFLGKVSELLRVPDDRDVPVGPLPGGAGAAAVSLHVVNASFEEPGSEVHSLWHRVVGWSETEDAPDGVAGWHAMGTGRWNWYPPHGNSVLVLQKPRMPTRVVSVSQVLAAVLQPNTRYRLSVWAGQRMDHALLSWPKVVLALYAGDRLLGAVDVPRPRIMPHVGVWVEHVVTYTSPRRVVPGQPLRVVISRTGSGTAQACLDNVALQSTPVRPPSATDGIPAGDVWPGPNDDPPGRGARAAGTPEGPSDSRAEP